MWFLTQALKALMCGHRYEGRCALLCICFEKFWCSNSTGQIYLGSCTLLLGNLQDHYNLLLLHE